MDNMERCLNFLEFPTEIRLTVYKALDDIVKDTNNAKEDDTPLNPRYWRANSVGIFELTRKSLRLTCKQVNEEWTPFFLRSSIIFVNHMGDPWHLTDQLSNARPANRIAHVRHIEFEFEGKKPMTQLAKDALSGFSHLLAEYKKLLRLEYLTVSLYGREPYYSVSNSLWPRGRFSLEELDWIDDGENPNLAMFGNNMLAGPLRGASVTAFFGQGCFKLFFERAIPKQILHTEPDPVTADSDTDQRGEDANAAKNSSRHNEHPVTDALGLDPESSSTSAHETSNSAAGQQGDIDIETRTIQSGEARGQKRPFSEVEE